ncbi:MAG: hypothetical protein ISR90_03645 [Candidatus Marinimicrobia bacterium]|nr:hypothetical protein [Candidatus Neomarinimicrobiota bacterium]MBL7023134.1 hypothetical protein [Candidatus Neomarinimicrobiota bacterium]MBL7109058.1 hypothetical protein [Candidatus Neomarinimicrobiota bacterium]
MKLIISIILVFSFLLADYIPTTFGNCYLKNHKADIDDIGFIEKMIIEETEKLTKEFGNIEKKPFTVHIAPSREEFDKITRGHAPEWSIALAMRSPDRIVILSPVTAQISQARLKDVIVHELNHVYIHRISNSYAPSWFLEGLAMRSSGEFSIIHKVKISQALWKSDILTLSKLNNIQARQKSQISLAYGQSAAAVYAMEFYYGSKVLGDILKEMRKGMDFDDAFQKITGDNRLDFQIKYFDFIEDNYSWIILLKTSRYIFVLLPLILIFGYYFRYKKNKKTMERWEKEEVERNDEEIN